MACLVVVKQLVVMETRFLTNLLNYEYKNALENLISGNVASNNSNNQILSARDRKEKFSASCIAVYIAFFLRYIVQKEHSTKYRLTTDCIFASSYL